MTTEITYAAPGETTETGAESATPREAGPLRGRSELIAEAARWVDKATYVSGRPISHGPRPDGDPHYGEQPTALREHAGVLLAMDQTESLAALAESAMLAGARDALIHEDLTDTVTQVAAGLGAAIEDSLRSTTTAVTLAGSRVAGAIDRLTEATTSATTSATDNSTDLCYEIAGLRTSLEEQQTSLDALAAAVESGVQARIEETEAEWAGDREDRVTSLAWGGVWLLGSAAVAGTFGQQWDLPTWLLAGTAVGGLVLILAAVLLTVTGVITARRAHPDDQLTGESERDTPDTGLALPLAGSALDLAARRRAADRTAPRQD